MAHTDRIRDSSKLASFRSSSSRTLGQSIVRVYICKSDPVFEFEISLEDIEEIPLKYLSQSQSPSRLFVAFLEPFFD
jgi:hypothetical protein